MILILADDLAWSDLGCYGHPYHQTPHLDRLAREGMRFTQAYAPSAICSASRAAIMTGKTPARLQFEFVTKSRPGSQDLGQPLQSPPYPTNLPLEEVTLAEALARVGYHTAFFGKWHLNTHHGGYLGWSPTHGPLQQGFAEGDSDFGGHPYAYFKNGDRNDLDLREGEFPPDSLTDKVIAFLQRKDRPLFFLCWWHYYVHDPVHTRCRWLAEKYRRVLPSKVSDERVAYAAMVETMDHEVGRMLKALDAAGLGQNTVIIFTSDNGGHPNYTGNGPFRGSKWNLYEGGIRVPMMVFWPGVTKSGSTCAEPVTGNDLFPTLCEIAGAPAEAATRDGCGLVPLVRGQPALRVPRSLVWHFPYYHPEADFAKAPARIGVNDFVTSQTRPHSAIRAGQYKLIHFYEDGRDELYDLQAGPDEQCDLAAADPARARALRQQLDEFLHRVEARMPAPAFTLHPGPGRDH